MRRIAACLIASTLCAVAAWAWLAPDQPRTASAITPTPSFTSTPLPYSQNFVLTNSTGSSAIQVSGAAVSFAPVLSLSANAPGCAPPVVTTSYQSIYVPVIPISLSYTYYAIAFHIAWPNACVDPGESITVTFVPFPVPPPNPPNPTYTFSGIATTPTATATTPTAAGLTLAIDCDVIAVGLQSNCTVPAGSTSIAVDVVLINNDPAVQIGAFNFNVVHSDPGRLHAQVPPACINPYFNCNPDFNQADVTGTGWACGPANPNPDYDPAPGDTSFISCFNGVGDGPLVGATPLRLARLTYDVPPSATAGSVPLSLQDAYTSNGTFDQILVCAPFTPPVGMCLDATINLEAGPTITPTPTVPPNSTPAPTDTPTVPATAVESSNLDPTPSGPYFAIDCDLAAAGVQDDCSYFTSAGALDVGVVLVTNGIGNTDLCCFNFRVHDPDTGRLNPPAIPDPLPSLNSNPDANQAALSPGYQCSPPLPDNDTGADGPGTAVSFLSCFSGLSDGPAIPAGGSILLGLVHYNVPGSAAPGAVPLNLDFMAAYDNTFSEIGSCGPVITEAATCVPAVVRLIDPPPFVHKVPDGNSNNADFSVPAANLWICETGFCAGPGEGELRVVERAENLHTGDQNGDTIEDGLGAYEFTVEYDPFVIQSINPCDIVFGVTSPPGAGAARGPVDELDSSAVNPDCFGDAGPAAPGTCALSIVLENLVHFGCVTGGDTPGPTGDFDLASLWLIPHPDLANDLFPGNNNGVLTVIKDNGCELVDIYGHPATGSVNGGLTPGCGDLAVTVRILEGDLDLDCDVDVTDAQLIASKYGAFFGGLLYSKWYDLEPEFHDLDIDIKDVQKVFGRDGSTCFEPIPAQPPLPPFVPFGE